ncbi:MAG: hypothetical protein K8S27_02920 [Candidatus Omnitrophica bacterium]|nr:hypothetical protein [Candidatus Omnitrophota bacterium]
MGFFLDLFIHISKFTIKWGVPLFIIYYFFKFWFCDLKKPDIKNENNKSERIKKFTIAIFSLLMAYLAYINVGNFLDEWLLFQLSDRCLVSSIKIDEKNRQIYPVFINQGGDAFAYNELVQKLNKTNDKKLQQQLLKIYQGMSIAEDVFDKNSITVNRTNNKGSWTFNNPNPFDELKNDFDVFNIIDQVRHIKFWTTSAQCAKFLQNDEYLRDKKNFNKDNIARLREYDWEKMFKNLTCNIENHPSLMVRKICTDTYMLWACPDGKKRTNCEDMIFKDKIYYFDNAIIHWKKNRKKILNNFHKNIGVD